MPGGSLGFGSGPQACHGTLLLLPTGLFFVVNVEVFRQLGCFMFLRRYRATKTFPKTDAFCKSGTDRRSFFRESALGSGWKCSSGRGPFNGPPGPLKGPRGPKKKDPGVL